MTIADGECFATLRNVAPKPVRYEGWCAVKLPTGEAKVRAEKAEAAWDKWRSLGTIQAFLECDDDTKIACFRQGLQESERRKKAEADLSAARGVMAMVHKDLKMRASIVSGERVVAVGGSVWVALCDAINAARAEGGE